MRVATFYIGIEPKFYPYLGRHGGFVLAGRSRLRRHLRNIRRHHDCAASSFTARPLALTFGTPATVSISGGVPTYSATATNSLGVGVSGSTLTITSNHAGASTVTVKDAFNVTTTLLVTVSPPLVAAVALTSGKGSAAYPNIYLGAGSVGKNHAEQRHGTVQHWK